jgi:hypothetical protein
MTLSVTLILLVGAASGCRGDGSQQVAEAVERFIDFGMSNEERPAEKSGRDVGPRPHYPERSRQVKQGRGKGTAALWVEVDLPHALDRQQVIEALDAELDRLLDETTYREIEVRALPGGLLRHGKTMGEARALRSGNDVRDVEREAWSTVRDEQPPLTQEQYLALIDLELALAGSKSADGALREVRARQGRKLLDSAIAAAQRRWSGPRHRVNTE